MASEQLMQEELQSSVVVSDADAFGDLDDDSSAGALERAAQLGVTHDDDNESEEEDEMEDAEDGSDQEEEEDGANEDNGEEDGVYESESVMDEDDEHHGEHGHPIKNEGDEEDDDDDDDEEEEEEEDDEEEADSDQSDEEDDELDADADVIEDAEGVGAVKIRPGETDDEDSEATEASAEASESSDEDWDENADNAEEEEEEEEEGGETRRATSVCVFCKQDEEHGPSESVGAFLQCSVCAENAHAECAQQHGDTAHDGEAWKCPDCVAGSAAGDEMDMDEMVGVENGTPALAGSGTTPKSTPALRSATVNAESFSEDPADNVSRSLRKRRTSPVEAEESGMSLRKRRQKTTDDLSVDGLGRTADVATTPSSVRSLRIKPSSSSLVSVEKRTRTSLILKMRVSGAELRKIFTRRRKYTRKPPNKIDKASRPDSARSAVHVGASVGAAAAAPLIVPSSYIQPFYSFFDKETEELKGKPYGGILTEAEADTSRTFPVAEDRRKFGEAKQQAEEERQLRLLATQMEVEVPKKRSKKAMEPASQIECIEFGGWEIGTWYAAPYPEEYSRNQVLYICEFCLKYMNSDYVAWRHKLKCPAKHPPGDEIYRHGSVSVFEVDGRKNPVYCQNLCLLAKLFLGSKTLYYDVEPFLFYVLCEYDELGYHFVGYFSKEKRASSQNNVSCILTLPIHQRKGYGNLLIDFSYLLTRVEKKTGSPEKPLSDMGLVSYRNYWRLMMCRYLLTAVEESKSEKFGLSIKHISDDTGMTADDVISALEGLRCLVRDPQTGLYAFRVDLPYCREYVAKWEAKKYVKLNPEALTWTPYVMGRGNATNFELAPALTAIAPRDEDEEVKPADAFIANLVNGDGEPAPVELANGDVGEEKHASDDMEVDFAATVVLASGEPKNEPEKNEPDKAEPTPEESPASLESQESPEAPEVDAAKQDEVPSQTPDGDVDADGDADADGDDDLDVMQADTVTEGRDSSAGSGEQEAESHEEDGQATTSALDDWTAAYAEVPPTRFMVFPPISARRFNYTRTTIGRSSTAPRVMTGPRGRSRYGAGSTRRASTSRPKTSSTRKKTGGTGRGPGRWPKGTKKSDYGNADSGPGLPPAWIAERQAREAAVVVDNGEVAPPTGAVPGNTFPGEAGADAGAGAEAEAEAEAETEDAVAVAVAVEVVAPVPAAMTKEEDVDEPMAEDTVQVHTPPAKLRNGVNASVFASGKSRSSPRLGKSRAGQAESEDTVMVGGKEK